MGDPKSLIPFSQNVILFTDETLKNKTIFDRQMSKAEAEMVRPFLLILYTFLYRNNS